MLIGADPRQEVVDLVIEIAVYDFGEHVGKIGLRIDARGLAGLDERGEDRPVFFAAVGVREERILAVVYRKARLGPWVMNTESWSYAGVGVNSAFDASG